MISFEAVIEKFAQNSDKTNWFYLVIPQALAQQLHPENRKAFRVKGFIDAVAISQIAVQPIKEGGYLLALKGELRRKLRKGLGQSVKLQLQKDRAELVIPELFLEALATEADAQRVWDQLPPAHQRYFVNHIAAAKTPETQFQRIAQSVTALSKAWSFGEMIRAEKSARKALGKS